MWYRRNADRELRDLERRGIDDPAGQARFLIGLVRSGRMTREELELLAYAGDQAASQVITPPQFLPIESDPIGSEFLSRAFAGGIPRNQTQEFQDQVIDCMDFIDFLWHLNHWGYPTQYMILVRLVQHLVDYFRETIIPQINDTEQLSIFNELENCLRATTVFANRFLQSQRDNSYLPTFAGYSLDNPFIDDRSIPLFDDYDVNRWNEDYPLGVLGRLFASLTALTSYVLAELRHDIEHELEPDTTSEEIAELIQVHTLHTIFSLCQTFQFFGISQDEARHQVLIVVQELVI